MTSDRGRNRATKAGVSRHTMTGTTWAGLITAAAVIVFVVLNRDPASVSFVIFEAQTQLWIALTVAALGGLCVGLFLGRRP